MARVFQALAPGQMRLQPFPVGFDIPVVAGQQQVVANAGAELNEAGGADIVHVHHQSRCQAEKVDSPVRLACQDRRHSKIQAADLQAVARCDAERRGKTFVGPYASRFRPLVRNPDCLPGTLAGAQLAAQRVGAADGLDVGQVRLPGSHDHAGKQQGFGDGQVVSARFFAIVIGQRVIGSDDQVAAHHLLRFALQALANPVAKEADGGNRSHRHDQSGEKQA